MSVIVQRKSSSEIYGQDPLGRKAEFRPGIGSLSIVFEKIPIPNERKEFYVICLTPVGIRGIRYYEGDRQFQERWSTIT